MKLLAAALVLLPWALLRFAPQREPGTVVMIGGDLGGYLAPCGCTKPMTGGIQRWASAVKRESIAGRTVLLHNGGLIEDIGRQDELKLAAAAQMLAELKVAALNLDVRDAALGFGGLETLNRLANSALFSSQVPAPPGLSWEASRRAGPFEVYGAASESKSIAASLQVQAGSLSIRSARPAVLLFGGTRNAAAAVARENPGLKLIVYQSSSTSQNLLDREGSTILISPGEHGKDLLKLWWQGGEFRALKVVQLGPEVSDDPAAHAAYLTYLGRVKRERLIDQMPRFPTEAFAGNAACASCHAEAYKIWQGSRHAKALATLEADLGHDQDPDCISCHVVGMSSTNGFRSRQATPELADVGCESCHGPAKAHALSPAEHPIKKVGEAACKSCHSIENSPKFRFEPYWQKIEH